MSDAPAFRAVLLSGDEGEGPGGGGLRGGLDVGLAPDALVLAGGDGRRVAIPFDAIDRLRFGYQTSRMGGRFYDMRVWTHRSARPLLLRVAAREPEPGYPVLARALASAVAARRGVGAIEAGIGWGDALFNPGIFLPFVACGLWGSFVGVRDGYPLPFLLLLPAVTLGVGGMFAYGFVRLWRPRRLRRLDELEPLVSSEARAWLF
ncbi:MAG: hypothetical protein JOZ90_03710 [Alphaproteobacteria bacterium]|nr:hypothetical protein [Alphaproteobacteria bacterium]MBV9372664.1 hypothetical protein [Alphaproteobacteria bacterium]MBV9900186.1 hypothetical protein [Alphaproteobacteria bacterium]